MKTLLLSLIFFSSLVAQDDTKFDRVKELLNNRDAAQAEQILDTFLNEDKNQPEVYYYLGVASLINQDFETSIDRLEKAIKLNDQDYRYYERLGDAFGMKAQKTNIFSAMFVIGDMRANWEKAVELKPDIVSARDRLFSYYIEAPGIAGGDKDKALVLANQVLALNPASGHMLLFRYYSKLEKDVEAEHELLIAAKLDSLNSNLMNSAGYYYLNRNNTQDALLWFDKYVSLKPDDPNSYDSRGDCFTKAEQYDSALVMYETALQNDPGFEPSLYKRARMLQNLNRMEEAKKAARQYLQKFPDGRSAGKAKKILDK